MTTLSYAGHVFRINTKPGTDGERGIPKQATQSASLTPEGFEGDFCVHRAGKNDYIDRAVLVIPAGILAQFRHAGWPVAPGDLGENLTTSGVAYEDFSPGKKYRIGDTAEIQITRPCRPCGNLRVLPYVGERLEEFKRFLMPDPNDPSSNRRGWYAKVLQPGTLHVKDSIYEVLS